MILTEKIVPFTIFKSVPILENKTAYSNTTEIVFIPHL